MTEAVPAAFGPALEGRRCVVTGGAQGIGAVLARELCDRGANVTVGDLVVGEDRVGGGSLTQLRLDVADERSVVAFFAEAASGMGGLDLLVNNAGVNRPGPTRSLQLSEWTRVLEVNLTGAWLCAREAEKHMRPGSAIVNVASIHAVVGSALHGGAAYAASKAGLVGLTRSLAVEWASRGIRVNAVAPTYVPTELTRERLEDPAYLAAVLGRQPLPVLATASDVAAAVCFLGSDEARMTTGAVLPVDGGWLAA